MIDIGFAHGHAGIVILYLLLLASKLVLMLLGQKNLLTTWNGRTRVVHIVLAMLMLLTGLYLVWRSPAAQSAAYIVKYVALLVAIVLGVIGVRRFKVLPTLAALVLMLYAYGVAKTYSPVLKPEKDRVISASQSLSPHDTLAVGRAIYTEACIRCHGADGASGYFGSKNLRTSTVPDAYKHAIIYNGHKPMPAYGYLSSAEVDAVVKYIDSLKE